MSPFTEAPDLPGGTGVDAALAGTAGRGQARTATSSCCDQRTEGRAPSRRAHQPLRERR